MNDEQRKLQKKRFYSLLFQLTELIKNEIYVNIIIPTINLWLDTNKTINELNREIEQNINERWEFLKYKIEATLIDYGDFSADILNNNLSDNTSNKFDFDKQISEIISNAVGIIGTSFITMISGGSGVALISGGPIGWIIGAVISGILFYYKSDEIKKNIEKSIINKKIPSFIKKMAQNKILKELQLQDKKFEKEVYELLKDKLSPFFISK